MHGGKLATVISCLLASATTVVARGRLIRTLDARQGLDVPSVASLAQDARGFLWIGSVGGLMRYDGQEIRRIAPGVLATTMTAIRPTPDGALFVADAGGAVSRVADEIATAVPGPDGKPLAAIGDIWVEPSGALWTVGDDHTIHRRDRDGRWSEPLGRLDGANLVRGASDGRLYVASRTLVWRVDGPRVVVVAHAERIVDLLAAADGSLYVLESHGHVWRVVGDHQSEIFRRGPRAISLAQRGRVIWVVYDSALVAIPPSGRPEVLGRTNGVAGGGPILVDTEGSLWLGTDVGVLQFPEPDTAVWDVPDGLPASPYAATRSPQ
jgi:hypothetical protein